MARLEPQTIVPVRLDHMGDLILSTPFLQALRYRYPDATIRLLAKPYAEDLLVGVSYLDELVIYRGEVPETCMHADLAIALAPRTETMKVAYETKAKERLGYYYSHRPLVGLMSSFWLTRRVPIQFHSQSRVLHEVEQLRLVGDLLDLDCERYGLQIGYAEDLRAKGRGYIAKAVPNPKAPVLLFHAGIRWWYKDWTTVAIAQLIHRLSQKYHVVVTCGPEEVRKAKALRAILPRSIEVLTGLSIQEWAGTMEAVDFMVTCDTGSVHLGATVNLPMVVVYDSHAYRVTQQQWTPLVDHYYQIKQGNIQGTTTSVLAASDALVGQLWEGV